MIMQLFLFQTDRVHDVYVNRVLEILDGMQMIQLHALPEINEEPWTIDAFCNSIDNVCRNAAIELHKKSLMVEEAVEEIMALVKKVNIDTEENQDEEGFIFEGKIIHCYY